MTHILYQDQDLLLVEKPAGVLSQWDSAGGDSLPRQLEREGFTVKPVHRLDRNTGGVMVYARSERAAAALSEMVCKYDILCKEYLAVISGCPTDTAGTYEDLLYHDVRKNKSYVVKRMRNGVRTASLSYAVVQSVQTPDGRTLSLIRVRLHTGRTHQIRVQFASRGMPLVGDARYGGERGCSMALWSHRITFPHPFTQMPIEGISIPTQSSYPWNLFANL